MHSVTAGLLQCCDLWGAEGRQMVCQVRNVCTQISVLCEVVLSSDRRFERS
jgi:hypothetical protein